MFDTSGYNTALNNLYEFPIFLRYITVVQVNCKTAVKNCVYKRNIYHQLQPNSSIITKKVKPDSVKKSEIPTVSKKAFFQSNGTIWPVCIPAVTNDSQVFQQDSNRGLPGEGPVP